MKEAEFDRVEDRWWGLRNLLNVNNTDLCIYALYPLESSYLFTPFPPRPATTIVLYMLVIVFFGMMKVLEVGRCYEYNPVKNIYPNYKCLGE